MTETVASVGVATSITQGGINKNNLVAIDSDHQLQSVVNKSHKFTNMGKKGNK